MSAGQNPLNRRRLLRLGAGAAGLGAAGLLRAGGPAAAAPAPLYLSACADREGRFYAGGFTAEGELAYRVALPQRGHALAVAPGGDLAVQFARRPGTYALVFDARDGSGARLVANAEGRRFNGHGTFSAGGRLLYASENDFEGERGVVGVYDRGDGFRRVAELPSHGLGPHDLCLLPDGQTLVVANGGIQTDPELGRIKLNIPTMAPSLAYLDRRDGTLLRKVVLPRELHMASIRHLAVRRDGLVAFALQYEGPRGDLVPLVATHRGDAPEARLFQGPERTLRALDHYVGSAALDAGGRYLAVSSPRGGVVQVWDIETAAPVCSATIPDGCGVAALSGSGLFLASSGAGGAFLLEAASGTCRPLEAPALQALRWDHHIVPRGG
ncbi:MAG: DUF1513 domain-containing protein [Tistlia sp.]|uniref:DUF1513 domain-containing protein n=1 Tax=Tistlia sp. TaxID=3057121 RepID=UPI0034A4F057